MEHLISVFKALSDRNRLRVVAALMQAEELCPCQLVELLQVTGATASRHMGMLIAAGLVTSRKKSRWVFYRLQRKDPDFSATLTWVQGTLEKDPGMLRDAKRLKQITAVEPEELCRKQRGEACCPTKER